MRKIIAFIFVFMVISCGTVTIPVVKIPPFFCPEKVAGDWKGYSTDKTDAENLRVQADNIDMARRIISNRDIIIKCYSDHFDLYTEQPDEDVDNETSDEDTE